jgi:IS605 OrfB family transposase
MAHFWMFAKVFRDGFLVYCMDVQLSEHRCPGGACALHLPVQAVQEIAEKYARRRRQHRKMRLAWRKSGGARQVYFAGRWLSLWDSYGLGNFELRAGNFSEDSRGRWYLNVIDLGLTTFAAFSEEALPPIEAERFYRDLEPPLARAQRARHRNRSRAIHAKIANRRKDFLHKLSTDLVKANGAIFVGNVNASALMKTRQAKSVLDAGWSAFRTMLQYKCAHAGVWFAEVDEAFSTQTCSVCGAIHDRNVNAAHNILAAGHRRLAEGILVT